MPDNDVYDVIVVGAGTGGCILASRIAENGVNPSTGERLKVALFDGGPYLYKGGRLRPGVGDPWRRRVVTNIRQDETGTEAWHYDGFNVKAVGGCSLHWGANAFMPIPKDYSNWQKETGVDWSEEKFKDAIEEAVKMWHVHPAPLDMLTADPPKRGKSKAGQMFVDAATAAGLKVDPPADPRDKGITGSSRANCLFCGYCGRGHYCKYDSKATGLWYVKLIGEENGLEVIPDAEVDHVIIEKSGASFVAKGIAYTRNGQKKEARAPRVIVSCGPNGTPLVLYQSGYGPKDFLGQKLVVENDNVGRHLDGDLSGASLDIQLLFGEDVHGAGGGGGTVLIHEDGDHNKLTLSGIGGMAYTGQYPEIVALHPVAPQFGWEHKEFMRTAVQKVGFLSFAMRSMTWGKGRIGMSGEHLYRRDDPAVLGHIQKAWPIAQDIIRRLNPKPIRVDDPLPKSFAVLHEVGTARAGVSKKDSVVTPDFDSHDVEGLMIGSGAVIPCGNHTLAHMPIATVNAYAWRRIVANHFTRGSAPLKG